MTAQGERLFLQFALTFQIIGKRFPLLGSLVAVVLRQFLVNELLWVAIIKVIADTHFFIVFPRPFVVQNEIKISS